jgi:hypothetical protein
MGEKRCPKCSLVRPVIEYGPAAYCRECMRVYNRERASRKRAGQVSNKSERYARRRIRERLKSARAAMYRGDFDAMGRCLVEAYRAAGDYVMEREAQR